MHVHSLSPALTTLTALTALFAMTNPAGGAAVERAIHLEVEVAAPIAEVWQAWTTRDGVRTFFAPDALIEMRPNGPYEIYFGPHEPVGKRGGEGNQVLAIDPPRMLAVSWNAPPSLPTVRDQRTHVTIRLTALSADRTRVVLHHTGWSDGGEWDQAFGYFERAWGQYVLPALVKRFESGPRVW